MPESRGSRVFRFLNTSKSFPKWLHHFILAATVREMPGSSASLPARGAALVLITDVMSTQSAVSLRFYVHFPDDVTMLSIFLSSSDLSVYSLVKYLFKFLPF